MVSCHWNSSQILFIGNILCEQNPGANLRIMVDISTRMVHINALANFLEGHRPGTALVGVAKLGNPKLKFEIEAVAAVEPLTASL
jgi:hypothetical protein